MRQPAAPNEVNAAAPLIDPADVDEFVLNGAPSHSAELKDILYRAITFALPSPAQSLEVTFLSLSASLESILTFFRRQDEYKILPAAKFSELERDLKKWLKQHPVLKAEAAKRALIYEKFRELNRFPMSHVFETFCTNYSLDLADLWPVTGKHADWPLTEIRHRLVHGDPFNQRPHEAVACAEMHLHWVVERMLLSVLGWPIERSNVRREILQRDFTAHGSWEAERAKFSRERKKKLEFQKSLALKEMERLEKLGTKRIEEWRLVQASSDGKKNRHLYTFSALRSEDSDTYWGVVKVNIRSDGTVARVRSSLHRLTESHFGADNRILPITSREVGQDELHRLQQSLTTGAPAGGFESPLAKAVFYQFFTRELFSRDEIIHELAELLQAFDKPVIAKELVKAPSAYQQGR
ncbi:MAG: hypothetical protein QOD75_3756 [Blastocatellia bacterium]|nr:hypothetical protein [Blastocatellia bacterium]